MALAWRLAQVFLLWCVLFSGPFARAQTEDPCPLITPPSAFIPSISYKDTSPITAEIAATLDSTIASFVAENSILEYAVSVVHREQTVYTSGLAATPFGIGSIAKTFVALGAFILRDKGLLSLEDPVKKFLPNFSIINPYDDHDITLRELMGHVAGMPRELCIANCPVDEAEALASISKMQLILPPWSREPAYSNLGFAVLGHAWEKATSRKSWQRFIMEHVVKPLGLNDTGTNFNNVTLASTGIISGRGAELPEWLGPAGLMYSSAIDLAKYMKFLLNASPPLISASSIREWTRSSTIFPDRQGGFALPWELISVNFTREFIITKGGAIGNFLSIIAIHPPMQLGVSALVTVNNFSVSIDELASRILRTLVPAVKAMNEKIIDSYYAGLYICEHTPPVYSFIFNTTYEVLGGSINISGSPRSGLSASMNVSMLSGGQPAQQEGTMGMLLKNSTENSFWVGDSSTCSPFFLTLGAVPSVKDPNSPRSVFYLEILFDLPKKTLRWPSMGSVCMRR